MMKAETVEKTARQVANDAGDAADRTVQAAKDEAGNLLAELKPAVDALAGRVHTLAKQGRALALDAGHQTRDGVLQARDRASDHIAEKPLQSLAMATVAGLVFGWLISRR